MSGWAEVLLAIGPATMMGLFMWLNSRSQSKTSIERLERELSDARQRDVQQRSRDVRGEPLMAFRRELATMAQKRDALVRAEQLQHTRAGITEAEAQEFLRVITEDWNSYVTSGDYERSRFQIDDQDILNKATELSRKFASAYVETTDRPRSVFKELEEIQGDIRELQGLINEKLMQL